MADTDLARCNWAVPLVLASVTAVSVLSTDLFTPSIPDLPEVFDSDIVTVQQAVSINLLAYALSHLVHGPLADTIGRRALLIYAFVFFIAASILCALAPSIDVLLAGRFLQGLFSSVPSVVVVLIIRELFSERSALQVMALYGAAIGLAPAIGPLLGGYLHVWFGWSAAFWTIAGLATLSLLVFALVVPETLKERRPLHVGQAFKTYLDLLRRPAYLAALLPICLVFGAFYAFVTTAPAVFIDVLGVRTENYGLLYIIVIAAFIAGNLVAERLSHSRSAEYLFNLSLWLSTLAALMLAGPSLAGVQSVSVIIVGMVPYAAALGIVLVAGPMALLNTVGDLPQGPASALLGAFQLGSAALASWLSAAFYRNSSVSMTVTMAAFCLLATLSVALRHRHKTP